MIGLSRSGMLSCSMNKRNFETSLLWHKYFIILIPLGQEKKKVCLRNFWQNSYVLCDFFFFKENELCAMRDFFFYCVFGPLFFFFAKKRKILPLRGKIFHFFSDKQKKKKKKLSKARPMRKIGFHIPMRASFWDKPFFSWP